MNENDKRSDKARPNFDLTTPNIAIPHGDQAAHRSRPVGDDDRTTLNPPPAGSENRAGRPAAARNNYDLTSVNISAPFDEEEEPARPRSSAFGLAQKPLIPTPAKEPAKRAAARSVPPWVWLSIGGVALLLTGSALALFFLSPDQAFTLRVLKAPPGSKVFIDNIPSGVQQGDGTIIVQGLRADEPREVRVTQDGFAEWKTTVTGTGGEVQSVTVNLTRLEPKAPTLSEIDYNGRMILIPAGAFTMGANDGNADEAPAHTIDLPSYYIDKFEVTNEQYGQFCSATARPQPVNPFWDLRYFENNPQMPVIGVSYQDAAAYATWAGKRLPSESEWEKAASWGPNLNAKRRFPWGDAPAKDRANLGTEHPSNVGQYAAGASAYGVHDLSGNVREWVNANYNAYPGSTASNPKFGQGLRVARGGDFRASPDFARTTGRLPWNPSFKTNPGDDKAGRSSLIGFRCAVSADDPRLSAHLQQSSR